MMLDEENENYGYGILNVNQNSLIPIVELTGISKGYFENDHIVEKKEEVVKAYRELFQQEEWEEVSEASHLRVVRINLANELDEKAVKEIEKLERV